MIYETTYQTHDGRRCIMQINEDNLEDAAATARFLTGPRATILSLTLVGEPENAGDLLRDILDHLTSQPGWFTKGDTSLSKRITNYLDQNGVAR